MDGVEFTPCGADTAAEAFVGVNDRYTAAEAACGFLLELFLGEGLTVIPELGDIYPAGILSGSAVVVSLNFVKIEIILVKRLVLKTVSADCEALTLLNIAVDGYRTLLAGGNPCRCRRRQKCRAVRSDRSLRLLRHSPWHWS